MTNEIERIEWDFQRVKLSQDVSFVKAIRDWEYTREVHKRRPELFDWIFDLRQQTGGRFLEEYQGKHELRAGLWTISPEFPDRPALSVEAAELQRRIRKLLPVLPLSQAEASLVSKRMGKTAEKLVEWTRSANVFFKEEADAFVCDNSIRRPGSVLLVFPVSVDLEMSRKTIVESFGLLLDKKLETLGLEAGLATSVGRKSEKRIWTDELRQLAAYRFREVLSEKSGKDWWITAQEISEGLYSRESSVPWNRAADAAEELIHKRCEEVRLLDPNVFLRKHALEMNQKARELGVEEPFPDME